MEQKKAEKRVSQMVEKWDRVLVVPSVEKRVRMLVAMSAGSLARASDFCWVEMWAAMMVTSSAALTGLILVVKSVAN